jgi:hypothetical protein
MPFFIITGILMTPKYLLGPLELFERGKPLT